MKLSTYALTVFLFGAMASTYAVSAQKDQCDSTISQGAMTECYGNQAKKADAELGAVYGKLIEKLKGLRSQAILRDAERAWADYRYKECAFEAAGTEGGSVQSIVSSICFRTLTLDRIKTLSYQLNCPEGDLICADGAQAIWDGEWTNSTKLLIRIVDNTAVNFYWHGDYQEVKASRMTDNGQTLSFDWHNGTVILTLTEPAAATARIKERGQPDVQLVLAR